MGGVPATPPGLADRRRGGTSLAQTPYDREHFGQRWADVDRNGCDTRNDTLRHDLDALVVTPRQVNRNKGASDAATWVSPRASVGCAFTVHMVRVKQDHGLAVGTQEALALAGLLSTCDPSSPALVGAQ